MIDRCLDFKWHAHNYSKLRVEKWAEETIVFNPQSGETHQLNDFAMAVLDLIQQPITLETLTDQIFTFYEIKDRKKLSNQLISLISQFDDLGLIEPYLE